MAKQKSNRGQSLNRRQLARREKEQRVEQTLIWAAVGIGILIALILGYGIVTEFIIKARQPVAQIGDLKVSTRDYEIRQYYERLMARQDIQQYQYYLDQFDPNDESTAGIRTQLQSSLTMLQNQLSPDMANIFAGQVLDSMIEETLIRQEAEAQNLVVSEAEIELEIERMMGYDREASATVTDTTTIMTEAQYQEIYESFKENILEGSNFSEVDFKEMMKTSVLRTKLQEVLGADVENTADQVESMYLIAGTEAAALALQERINDEGEDVALLLDELNNDEDTDTSGYDLSWLPLGLIGTQLGAEIEKVAFNSPVGKASEPIMGSDGRYYVVYVTGHEERPLDENMLAQAQQEKYNAWLEEQETTLVERKNWEEAVLIQP